MQCNSILLHMLYALLDDAGRVYQVHCIDVKDIKGTTKNGEECNKTCGKAVHSTRCEVDPRASIQL